jgi:hypothetical protein
MQNSKINDDLGGLIGKNVPESEHILKRLSGIQEQLEKLSEGYRHIAVNIHDSPQHVAAPLVNPIEDETQYGFVPSAYFRIQKIEMMMDILKEHLNRLQNFV